MKIKILRHDKVIAGTIVDAVLNSDQSEASFYIGRENCWSYNWTNPPGFEIVQEQNENDKLRNDSSYSKNYLAAVFLQSTVNGLLASQSPSTLDSSTGLVRIDLLLNVAEEITKEMIHSHGRIIANLESKEIQEQSDEVQG